MRRSIWLVALSHFLVACSGSVSSTASEGEDRVSTVHIEAFFAPLCDEAMNPADALELRSIDLSGTQGLEKVCIDSSAKRGVNPDVTRVHIISADHIVIELECARNYVRDEAFARMPEEGQVALVLGNKVHSIFNYLDKSDLIGQCGIIPSAELLDAIEFCESFQSASGGNARACESYCDAKGDQPVSEVCVVGGGAGPARRSRF